MKRAKGRFVSGLIAALDIGSTKMCCMIARPLANGFRVIGVGYQQSHGVRNGSLIHQTQAREALARTVHTAEQTAGETIRSVWVNVSGGQPRSELLAARLSLGGHEITQDHISYLIDSAVLNSQSNGQNPQLREQLHTFPIEFKVDYERGITDPAGLYADELGALIHVITTGEGALQNLKSCITQSHLTPKSIVLSAYAAALGVLNAEEKQLGATVIDMGGGTTSVVIFHHGVPVYTDLLPIGGNHISQDIAQGLGISLSEAERIKTLYGSAFSYANDDQEHILLRASDQAVLGDQRLPKTYLIDIIQPRLEEIFEQVNTRLKQVGLRRYANKPIVVTGGGARMVGILHLARRLLERRIRLGMPLMLTGVSDVHSGPEFAVAAGLLAASRYPPESLIREPVMAHHQPPFKHQAETPWHEISRWLKTYF